MFIKHATWWISLLCLSPPPPYLWTCTLSLFLSTALSINTSTRVAQVAQTWVWRIVSNFWRFCHLWGWKQGQSQKECWVSTTQSYWSCEFIQFVWELFVSKYGHIKLMGALLRLNFCVQPVHHIVEEICHLAWNLSRKPRFPFINH